VKPKGLACLILEVFVDTKGKKASSILKIRIGKIWLFEIAEVVEDAEKDEAFSSQALMSKSEVDVKRSNLFCNYNSKFVSVVSRRLFDCQKHIAKIQRFLSTFINVGILLATLSEAL